MAESHRRQPDLPSMPAQTFSSQGPPSSAAVPSTTPPTSPRSASRLKLVSERGTRRRAGASFSMLPEIVSALLWRACTPMRVAWRRNWVYRQFLGGRLADRFSHPPVETLAQRLEDADMLLKGRFRFAGQLVEAKHDSIFDATPPSRAWACCLHGFEWLGALAVAGGDAARNLGVQLVIEWLERHACYSEPAWLPEVMSRRLLMLLAHGRLVLTNSDILWRSKLFVSLRQQTAQLGRIAKEAPP